MCVKLYLHPMYIWGSTHGPKKSNTLSTLLRVIGMYSNNKNLIKINNNCFKKQSAKAIHLYPSRSLSPTGFLHLSVFQFLSSPVFLMFSFFPCLSPTPSFFFCRSPPVFCLSSSYSPPLSSSPAFMPCLSSLSFYSFLSSPVILPLF